MSAFDPKQTSDWRQHRQELGIGPEANAVPHCFGRSKQLFELSPGSAQTGGGTKPISWQAWALRGRQ
jgi:hypothetical protein